MEDRERNRQQQSGNRPNQDMEQPKKPSQGEGNRPEEGRGQREEQQRQDQERKQA